LYKSIDYSHLPLRVFSGLLASSIVCYIAHAVACRGWANGATGPGIQGSGASKE